MSHMRAEIAEQPDVVARTLTAVAGPVAELAGALRARSIETVILVARGTSDHAAIYARYLLEARGGLVASLAAPSLYTTYRAPVDLSRALVIGVSQSGETPEIVTSMAYARSRGALTAGLTNGRSSALVRAVDHPLVTAAGLERSVAATKTFTAQLAAVACLSAAISGERRETLHAIPEAMEATLQSCAGPAHDAAAALRDADVTVCVARGLAYAVALEAALKLKETTGIWAEGFSSADLRHGPAAAVGAVPALVFHAGGPLAADLDTIEVELRARGAHVVSIGPARAVPTAQIAEHHAALTLVLPAQVLAERLSRLRGRDPDRPPGLTKVTATT